MVRNLNLTDKKKIGIKRKKTIWDQIVNTEQCFGAV